MKKEKIFDGDKIYEVAVTLFAGTLAIGALLAAVFIENIF